MGDGQGYDQGCHCTEPCRRVRSQAEWHLHLPGLLPCQDPCQAGYEGVQEGDLWGDAHGEGKARSHDREGFPCGGFEGEHLRLPCQVRPCRLASKISALRGYAAEGDCE